MQILKIAVVEEEGFPGIESDGAAAVVIEDMEGVAFESVGVCRVEKDGGEELQCGGIGCEEFFGGETARGRGVSGEEDADVGGGADVGYVLGGFGVAVCACFFDVVVGGVVLDGVGIVGARCLD